ncbi:hypothetical protein BC833DRAFT_611350 [Globomyces pollinis-pini]|nr:hypothetical protein BC833DRAFT_611350 [Globomyces pollinis-pini]
MDAPAFWNATCSMTGHLPELFLLFLLIPITRNSFFGPYFNIKVHDSIKYHQITSNLFGFSMLVHFTSCGTKFALKPVGFWSSLLPTIVAWKHYKNYFGLIILTCFIFIWIFSLPIIRRGMYKLFLVFHLLLPIPIVFFSAMHASSVIYFVFPALALYMLDILLRIYTMLFKPYKVFASIEECGWIRIDIIGVKMYQKLKNGLYVNLKIKNSLEYFAHPFSIAACPSANHIVLMIKPSISKNSATNQLQKNLIDQLVHEQLDQPTDISVESSLKLSGQTSILASIDGPFNCNIFPDLSKIDTLVCIIGGSGIAATTQLIDEFMFLYPERKIYLHWAFKNTKCSELSIIQDIMSFKHPNLHLHFYNSQIQSQIPVDYHYSNERLNSFEIISHHVNISTGLIGIHTCGPESLMHDVYQASSKSPDRIQLQLETYEW